MSNRSKYLGILSIILTILLAMMFDLLNWPSQILGIIAIMLEASFFVSLFDDDIYST